MHNQVKARKDLAPGPFLFKSLIHSSDTTEKDKILVCGFDGLSGKKHWSSSTLNKKIKDLHSNRFIILILTIRLFLEYSQGLEELDEARALEPGRAGFALRQEMGKRKNDQHSLCFLYILTPSHGSFLVILKITQRNNNFISLLCASNEVPSLQ